MKTRDQLIQEYHNRKPIVGVFQIKNLTNGKILLEASADMPSKMNRHKAELRFGTHRNRQLQHDWKTDGEENFDVSIVSQVPFKEGDNQLYLDRDAQMLLEIVEASLAMDNERY